MVDRFGRYEKVLVVDFEEVEIIIRLFIDNAPVLDIILIHHELEMTIVIRLTHKTTIKIEIISDGDIRLGL
jgi:hypothetical protein